MPRYTKAEAKDWARENFRGVHNVIIPSYTSDLADINEQAIRHDVRRNIEFGFSGTMLFPVPLWGFERLHAASISVDTLERLVDDVPNVVAIKAEGGAPSVAGFAHVWNRLSDRIVVSMPIIEHAISLATMVPLQVIATSNTEFYSS